MVERISAWSDRFNPDPVVPLPETYRPIRAVPESRGPVARLRARFYQKDNLGRSGWRIAYSDMLSSPYYDEGRIEQPFVNPLSPRGYSMLVIEGRNFDRPRVGVGGDVSISLIDALDRQQALEIAEWGRMYGEVSEEELCITRMWVEDL